MAPSATARVKKKESLVVLLLNAEGDRFNASFVAEGAKGGQSAAEMIYALMKDKLGKHDDDEEEEEEGEGTEKHLIVHLVSSVVDNAIGSGQTKAFFRGFASTSRPCFVVEPVKLGEGVGTSSSARMLQLLKVYVPLASVSKIFLGSLHNTSLYSWLLNLDPVHQKKITLVSTITVAPPFRVLVDSNTVTAWRGLEPLFGRLAVPDLSELSIVRDIPTSPPARIGDDYDGVQQEEEEEEEEEKGSVREGTPPSPNTEEYLRQFIWDTSSSSSESEDEEEEWEVAGPRSNKKPSGLVLHGDSNPPSSSSDANSPTRQNGGSQRERKYGFPLSKTSGASRRRKQRERDRRGHLRREKSFQDRITSTTMTLQGPVSPLPAWSPPRLTFTEPHPCINHYLSSSGCQQRTTCPYSHEYEWKSREEEEVLYPLFIKSMICTKYLQGSCKKGDEDCVKGHRCPSTLKGCRYGAKCYYLTQGLPHSSPV